MKNKTIFNFSLKKITILDLLLGLFLVFTIFFYFLFLKRSDEFVYIDVFSPSRDWIEESYPINRWQTSAVSKGDVQYNSFGKVIAEVVDTYRTPWDGGKNEYMFITVKLKVNYSKNTRTYSFNDSQLLFGDNFSMETTKATIKGKIVNIYRTLEEKDSKFKHKKVVLTVRYSSQQPWIADKLLSKNTFYNDMGKIMFSITEVKVSPAREFYPNWKGQMVLSLHPEKKDVVAKIEIPEAECSNYNCFYNYNFPLVIGWDFPLDFNDLFVTDSTIMDVKYED